ncbi:hypothetical protein BDP27DRAFT_1190220, partial [Rhodocollybia butyracea]
EVIDLTGLDENSDEDQDSASEEEESSDDGVPELQLNKESRSQLYLALSAVPEAQIRNILTQLIEQVPAVEYALTKEFVTLKRRLDTYGTRMETCAQCDEEFDMDFKRTKDECSFHPGHLEPDYDSFEDWDEDVHGPIDSTDTRKEFPENFLWSCCGEDGVSEGCVQSTHK